MKRRDILAATAAAPIGALSASVEAARLSRQQLIEHHKSELFRLCTELAPDGAHVTKLIAHIEDGLDFVVMTASRPEWTGNEDPFYSFCSGDDGWTLNCRKSRIREREA